MYSYEVKPSLRKILNKISKKDSGLYKRVIEKISEIINSYDISHYKNLRYDLKEFKRAHVGPFVLVFKHDKNKNLISFEDFDHHDNIYQKKF